VATRWRRVDSRRSGDSRRRVDRGFGVGSEVGCDLKEGLIGILSGVGGLEQGKVVQARMEVVVGPLGVGWEHDRPKVGRKL